MKIKHYQGYGSVNATKIPDKTCKLHIQVVGNHECGIERHDIYDLFYWLVKRFDKSFADFAEFQKAYPKVEIASGCKNVNGVAVSVCDYRFHY